MSVFCFPPCGSIPGFFGVLPKGMPVAQCLPISCEALSFSYAAFDPAEARRYDETAHSLLTSPGIFRRLFRAQRSGVETSGSPVGEGEAEISGTEP